MGKKAYDDVVSKGATPKLLVIINPGNPTGASLPRASLEAIVRFVEKRPGLVLAADEVYQENVYGDAPPFISFKKIVRDLGSKIPLVSFHSISKGFTGECGLRGGYFELTNIDTAVKAQGLREGEEGEIGFVRTPREQGGGRARRFGRRLVRAPAGRHVPLPVHHAAGCGGQGRQAVVDGARRLLRAPIARRHGTGHGARQRLRPEERDLALPHDVPARREADRQRRAEARGLPRVVPGQVRRRRQALKRGCACAKRSSPG